MKKKVIITMVSVLFILVVLAFVLLESQFHFLAQKEYQASDFSITDLKSDVDADQDGLNDYLDIVESARRYIQTKPTYKSVYYDGGYPNDGYGVCTDVIWQALKGAGYSLKDLIDEDIANHLDEYSTITTPEPNIDFRRVQNLKIFFDRNIEVLPLDQSNIENWQPGDIVLTGTHIMILSDKRNKEGLPFIIHHDNFGARERNEIMNYELIGHYRFKLNNENKGKRD